MSTLVQYLQYYSNRVRSPDERLKPEAFILWIEESGAPDSDSSKSILRLMVDRPYQGCLDGQYVKFSDQLPCSMEIRRRSATVGKGRRVKGQYLRDGSA
jgi:hypothetical protein